MSIWADPRTAGGRPFDTGRGKPCSAVRGARGSRPFGLCRARFGRHTVGVHSSSRTTGCGTPPTLWPSAPSARPSLRRPRASARAPGTPLRPLSPRVCSPKMRWFASALTGSARPHRARMAPNPRAGPLRCLDAWAPCRAATSMPARERISKPAIMRLARPSCGQCAPTVLSLAASRSHGRSPRRRAGDAMLWPALLVLDHTWRVNR